MEPFLLDASKQGTHLLRGQKIWSLKNVFIVSTGNRETFFWVPKPGFNLIQAKRDNVALKKWQTKKIVDKFKSFTSHNGKSFQNMNYLI